MTTKQATLSGMLLEPDDQEEDHQDEDDENEYACPLCGDSEVTKVGLPDHIASDDCDSELKEVNYEF